MFVIETEAGKVDKLDLDLGEIVIFDNEDNEIKLDILDTSFLREEGCHPIYYDITFEALSKVDDYIINVSRHYEGSISNSVPDEDGFTDLKLRSVILNQDNSRYINIENEKNYAILEKLAHSFISEYHQ